MNYAIMTLKRQAESFLEHNDGICLTRHLWGCLTGEGLGSESEKQPMMLFKNRFGILMFVLTHSDTFSSLQPLILTSSNIITLNCSMLTSKLYVMLNLTKFHLYKSRSVCNSREEVQAGHGSKQEDNRRRR